jgi:hypothetical protein
MQKNCSYADKTCIHFIHVPQSIKLICSLPKALCMTQQALHCKQYNMEGEKVKKATPIIALI